jgi:hypothetical protein
LEEKYRLTVEEIEKLKGSNHSWWAEFKRVMGIGEDVANSARYYQASPDQEPTLLTTEEVFMAEQEILKGIAQDESCIIAGRSGFFVFRKHPNHLSILIQASMDFRQNRVARKQDITPDEARKIIENVDKMRENYVNKYTKSSRYDTRNYDLVISSDGKTEDQIVSFILKYIGK